MSNESSLFEIICDLPKILAGLNQAAEDQGIQGVDASGKSIISNILPHLTNEEVTQFAAVCEKYFSQPEPSNIRLRREIQEVISGHLELRSLGAIRLEHVGDTPDEGGAI